MGMMCGHVQDELLRLSEGRLAPHERARVEAHLAHCPACRAAAADTLHLVDALQTLPLALRKLPGTAGRSWPAVWARVRGGGLRAARPTPQLSVYLSLAVVIFALAASLPAGVPGSAAAATAGMAQTPWPASQTPIAARVDSAGTALFDAPGAAGQAAWQAAGGHANDARPIPIPTPVPGKQGSPQG